MSGNFPFPIHVSRNLSTGTGAGDGDRVKAKPFRCGDCEQDFSAICLLHTHLRGGSYHYDESTMTAFPLSGTTCVSVFKQMRMKTETPKAAPDSTRKIFKIKKIRKKGKKKQGHADSDEDWTANNEPSSYNINKYEEAFNITPNIETVNDEAEADDNSQQETTQDFTEVELNASGQASGSAKKNKRQLVINLYGMDRNEDGSLRLVVGEKDSGVFKTPAGDAILKALKTKGKMFKGHMKVIYNYPDSVPDPDVDDEEEEADEELEEDLDDSDEVGTPRKMKTRSSRKRKRASKAKTDENSDTITIEPMSPLNSDSNVKVLKASSKETESRISDNPLVFKIADDRLSTMEATDILNEVLSGRHLEKIIRELIEKPKDGEVYLMDLDGLPKTKERRVDKFKWNNCGSKRYPRNKELIIKTVYKVKLPNGYFSDVFVKHFYQLIEHPRYCVVHYIGDPPVI